MDEISGYIEKIKYRNTENGYTVLSVMAQGEEYILVGNFSHVDEGEYIQAQGMNKLHPSYGEQLVVVSYEISSPKDLQSIERYLASAAIKGVGEALAARIVKKFKEDTLRIIEQEPERLAEVKGVSERMAIRISEQMENKRDMRDAMLYLQRYGISMHLSVKIFKEYGSELYHIISTNPYKLAEDISGIGFKLADDIARKVGIQADSKFRAMSGLEYILYMAMANGHLYLPQDMFLDQGEKLLGVASEVLEQYMMDMQMDRRIVVKSSDSMRGVYLSHNYYAEQAIAKMVCDLDITVHHRQYTLKDKVIYSTGEGIELDALQVHAVEASITSGILIITGGPGTGKTTTINTIIQYFEESGMEVLLAAPTGRAAKRMSEATHHEAKTIHRLLEITVRDEAEGKIQGMHFERNAQNPLEADVIIIDEMSMVDVHLMYALLKAIPIGTRLILVGDVNQLPSVGAGNVLKDIIDAGCFKVVRLDKIYRQALESDIIQNAHKMIQKIPIDLSIKSKDFIFIRQKGLDKILATICTLLTEKLPSYVDTDSFALQVMTPMRKGMLGVEGLNQVLQKKLNAPNIEKREKELEGMIFREGDKVMQIKNNYQREWSVKNRYGIEVENGLGVYNGDIGIIVDIDLFMEVITVKYDEERLVEYEFSDASELELSYAITIHKSQGSEYPAVVIPMFKGPQMLMTRNLLYTAITRAKKCVVLVGEPEVFYEMVENTLEMKRYTGLKYRIEEVKSLEDAST